MTNIIDYYQILGVKKTATAEEIRNAFRKAARANHPDSNGGDNTAAERFKIMRTAYEILHDPVRRARYDREQTRLEEILAESGNTHYSKRTSDPVGKYASQEEFWQDIENQISYFWQDMKHGWKKAKGSSFLQKGLKRGLSVLAAGVGLALTIKYGKEYLEHKPIVVTDIDFTSTTEMFPTSQTESITFQAQKTRITRSKYTPYRKEQCTEDRKKCIFIADERDNGYAFYDTSGYIVIDDLSKRERITIKEYGARHVMLSANGRIAAYVTEQPNRKMDTPGVIGVLEGIVTVIDLEKNRQYDYGTLLDPNAVRVTLSYNGTRAAFNTGIESRNTIILDIEQERLVSIGSPDTPRDISLSDDGTKVGILMEKQIDVVDVNTNQITTIPAVGTLRGLVSSGDGTKIAYSEVTKKSGKVNRGTGYSEYEYTSRIHFYDLKERAGRTVGSFCPHFPYRLEDFLSMGPAGDTLVFQSCDENNEKIEVLQDNKTEQIKVGAWKEGKQLNGLSLSYDGNFLYFNRFERCEKEISGNTCTYKRELKTGHEEKVFCTRQNYMDCKDQ